MSNPPNKSWQDFESFCYSNPSLRPHKQNTDCRSQFAVPIVTRGLSHSEPYKSIRIFGNFSQHRGEGGGVSIPHHQNSVHAYNFTVYTHVRFCGVTKKYTMGLLQGHCMFGLRLINPICVHLNTTCTDFFLAE